MNTCIHIDIGLRVKYTLINEKAHIVTVLAQFYMTVIHQNTNIINVFLKNTLNAFLKLIYTMHVT